MFAGLTVVIALVGLTIVNIPFLTVMGLAAAGTVTLAVLVSLTLLPALLGFAGHRLCSDQPLPRLATASPARRSEHDERPVGTVRHEAAHGGPCRRIPGLLAIAGPVTHLELGLPDAGSDPETSTERRAYDHLAEAFGPGFNGPLTIVVDAPGLTKEQQAEVATRTAEGLDSFPGVAAVAPPTQNPDGSITILSVTPDSSPSSTETKELVGEIR